MSGNLGNDVITEAAHTSQMHLNVTNAATPR
jgi:hypothetical protein